ncbi:hypothetical protein BC567DRAFT_252094 [Phyllosticta citribraziliensis]
MSLNGTPGDPSTNDSAGQPLVRPEYPSTEERERRFARFLKMPRNRNAWIVVNTGTFHICNNRNAFATYESTKPFVLNTVGDGDHAEDLGLNNTYTACGIGQDVLHIPDAFANVVSLPRLFQGESAYKLDAKRGMAFSFVDDRDLAWFPPDFQGLFCLALDGETPYFPGPSSLHRRAPVRSLSVHSDGIPLPDVINRFDRLYLVINLIKDLDPREEQSRNIHLSQKTEFTVAKILDLLDMQRKRTSDESQAAALLCPKERCFYRGAFVFKLHGDFAVCNDRDLFHNFTSIPPQPTTNDSAEVTGIGDLYLDVLFSDGSTGKLFIAGVLYSPKNPINLITYNCLFDPAMVCEGGSFDPTTGIVTDKNGGEVAWFTTCHLDGTLCLRQPDVRSQERKHAAPRVPPGLTPPENPTSNKATTLVNEKEISSAQERARAVSSGENNKVTFHTPNGSVGPPPVSGAGTHGKKMSCQAEVPENSKPAEQIDQAAFVFRNNAGEYRPAAEIIGREYTNDEATAASSQTPPNDTEFVDKANDALSALVADLAKKQPVLVGDLLANLRLPPFLTRTDPFFPLINDAIRDFLNLTHCFTAVAFAGKLTATQRHSYNCAISKILLLSEHGPAGLAEMVIYGTDMPLTPPSLDMSPTPTSSASPQTPRTPPPTREEMKFHDSPQALVERILLHGRAATKAIAEAGLNGDARAWHLATIVGGLAGPKVGSRITRHYRTAEKRHFGDMITAKLKRHDENGANGVVAGVSSGAIDPTAAATGAVLEDNHEKEDLSLKIKDAIEDVAHQKRGYAMEMGWDGTGTGDRKTALDHAAKKEEAVANGKTVTERVAPRGKPTQDDTRREESAQERPTAKDILQAAKQPFIAGLLKLNEQNLALREKRAAQKDATKAEPAKYKEQDAMAAMCKAGRQSLNPRLQCNALRQENERLRDSGCNDLAQTEEEKQEEISEQKHDTLATMMKLMRKQNLTREEQKTFMGDGKVRVLLGLAARCQQEALETLGADADDGKRETEKEKGDEAETGQAVEKGDTAEEQTAKDETPNPNGMTATEQVPIIAKPRLRLQIPTAGEEGAATRKENRCSLESLLQKRNEEKEKGESS